MTSARQLALALGLSGASGVAVLAATMEPGLGLAAFLGVLGAYAVWRAPVRTTFLGLMFLALTVENPAERPFAAQWQSPLFRLGEVLFTGLHHQVPLPFLRVSGMELLLLVLAGVVLARKAWGLTVEPAPLAAPKPLARALVLSFAAVLALEAWGLGRGGDVKQSLFQMRTLLFTPVVTALGLYALRGREDVVVVGKVLVLAATYRALLGAYFARVVAWPHQVWPPYVTTHTDTVLFALALLVLAARWWEAPTPGRLGEAVGWGLPILYGVYLNDRRLAWVTVAAGLAALYLVSPWNRARRFVTRAALVALPVLLAYGVVGWSSGRSVFKPVQAVKTVVAPEPYGTSADTSTEFRVLENFNLVQTWRGSPLVGSGFGHEYQEVVPLPDISRFMPDYRYLPHNGVLWLLGVGGVLGFCALFLYLPVGVFFAVRGYHAAVRPDERALLLVGLAAVIAYWNQAYGDMGTQSYTSVWTLAPLLALAGQLASASLAPHPLAPIGGEEQSA